MTADTSHGTSDPLAAELAAIRERFDSLAARYPLAEMAAPDRDGLKTHGGHIATSVLDVPRLLAAVEALLAGHQLVTETIPVMGTTWTYCAHCGIKPGGPAASWPCPTVAAVQRALTGEEADDA